MEKLSYQLPNFEGPLDLLLHLISKNKLDIRELPVALLLEQYLEQIRRMQEESLDIASEFLEMAARLVYMKSLALLPKQEEMETLRQELTGQLLEYQACREAAVRLAGHNGGFDLFVRQPMVLEADPLYERRHRPDVLLDAYLAAAGRRAQRLPPKESAFEGIVSHRIVPVSSKIVYVLRRLWGGTKVRFGSLFEKASDRSEMVATFLAVLELVKGRRVMVDGSDEDATLTADGDGRWK
ncbi:MAG: segregation/condensation protein A [Clostridiales bacterium]|nr:segregation/condensation protein A [Clostridiales bacterium]